MMKGISQKSILISGIVIVLAVILIGVILVQDGVSTGQDQYQVPSPEQAVNQYFTSWNNKDWPNMYATISDGFKKIDPNAKDLATFRAYASSQGVDGVRILEIKETANDGAVSTVQYSVEFIAASTRRFDGAFTLKYRPGDVIRGWKLVHPYGPNIDAS